MPGTIAAVKELARSFENEIGRTGAKAVRRFVLMLSDDTLTNGGPPPYTDIANALFGSATPGWNYVHPVHTALKLRKIIINERFEDNPYAIEVVTEWGLVTDDELLTPTARASQWAFESQPGQIPALWYYDGFLRPLTNSAGDFFPGLVTDESLVRIKVQRNFTSVPYNWLALQNHVNSATYLGCGPNTIKVVAVDVVRNAEEWNNSYQEYYTATASMLYRQSSHLLYLPDVGFNFIDGGQKRRGMVFDAQNGEWVPSANPIALNGFGAQVPAGQPAILPRRVNPQAHLEAVFGTP